jgi:hypothetical protein
MSREAQRALERAQDAARFHALERKDSIWVIRTRVGFRCTALEPCIGEHWRADPNGAIFHNQGVVA